MNCQYYIGRNVIILEGDIVKPLKVRISITLDDPIYQKIKGLAEYDDRSVSSYINLALRDHLEQLEREEECQAFELCLSQGTENQ